MRITRIVVLLALCAGCIAPQAAIKAPTAETLSDLGSSALMGQTVQLEAAGTHWQLASVHISSEALSHLEGLVPIGFELAASGAPASMMLAFQISHGHDAKTAYYFFGAPGNQTIRSARGFSTTDEEATYDIAVAVASNGPGVATLRMGFIPVNSLRERFRALPPMFSAASTVVQSEANGTGLWAGTYWYLNNSVGPYEHYVAGLMDCTTSRPSTGESLMCDTTQAAGTGVASLRYDTGRQMQAWTWDAVIQAPGTSVTASSKTANSPYAAEIPWAIATSIVPGARQDWEWQGEVMGSPLHFNFQRHILLNLTTAPDPSYPISEHEELEGIHWGWFGGNLQDLLGWRAGPNDTIRIAP